MHGDLARPGADVTVAIRPEKVRLVADGEGANRVAGKVETVLYQGERSEYLVRVGDALFSLYAPGDATDLSGRGVTLQFDPDAISLWPR
jgi:ABC-type Fe3+/spermidine/putrescine transport system ATPase subunit